MKRFLAAALALCTLSLPLAASADEALTELQFQLARLSALASALPVSCTIFTSKGVVRAGEQFTFAWYSTGSNMQSAKDGKQWAPSGAIVMKIDKPGTWKYTLKFYDHVGTEVPCSVSIVVLQ